MGWFNENFNINSPVWDANVLFYHGIYNPSEKASLGLIIGEENGKLLIHYADGISHVERDPKDTRTPREVWWYEFWKQKGFILSPWTHAGALAVFFLFIY